MTNEDLAAIESVKSAYPRLKDVHADVVLLASGDRVVEFFDANGRFQEGFRVRSAQS